MLCAVKLTSRASRIAQPRFDVPSSPPQMSVRGISIEDQCVSVYKCFLLFFGFIVLWMSMLIFKEIVQRAIEVCAEKYKRRNESPYTVTSVVIRDIRNRNYSRLTETVKPGSSIADLQAQLPGVDWKRYGFFIRNREFEDRMAPLSALFFFEKQRDPSLDRLTFYLGTRDPGCDTCREAVTRKQHIAAGPKPIYKDEKCRSMDCSRGLCTKCSGSGKCLMCKGTNLVRRQTEWNHDGNNPLASDRVGWGTENDPEVPFPCSLENHPS